MKFIKYLIFVFSISSCQDFLDRPPLDAIGPESYWRSATDLENYVLQFYPSFPGHGTWYGGYGYDIVNADNAINVIPNVILNGERGIAGGRWTSNWTSIRSVNIFFDNYQKCEDDFDTYKHFLGEAYFFRAWYYLELLKQYGDVPWYETELKPDDEEDLMKARDPRTLVADNIIADLDLAIEHLDFRNEVGNNRINKEAALAFKSRVGLFEGTWQKYHANTVFGTSGGNPARYFQATVDAAEELMSGNYQTGLHDNYYEMFGMDDMSDVDEILMYRTYNINDGVLNDVQYATTFAPVGVGITWSMVTSYLDRAGSPFDYMALAENSKGNDFLSRVANEIDLRYSASVWTPGDLVVERNGSTFDKPGIDQVDISLNPTGFQLKKCSNPSSPGAGVGGGGSGETGYILFRYGEVLVNYAEALYELEGVVAFDALNQIRARAGMPDFVVNAQTEDHHRLDYGYPISDELYEIRRERRVELALEGHRADDYRRWAAHDLFIGKRPKGYPFNQSEYPDFNPPLDENGLIDFFQNRLPNGFQFRENQDYLNPIPVVELTLNPNLTQNPGWQ
ncbi:MAG: RagB/SusD family nutrient uptake outer membrane protein [Cyclobacteriaceae bacterium]